MELGEFIAPLGAAIGVCAYFIALRLLMAHVQQVSLALRILFLVLAGPVVGLLGPGVEIGHLANTDQLQLYDPYKSLQNSAIITVFVEVLALSSFGLIYYLERRKGRLL